MGNWKYSDEMWKETLTQNLFFCIYSISLRLNPASRWLNIQLVLFLISNKFKNSEKNTY